MGSGDGSDCGCNDVEGNVGFCAIEGYSPFPTPSCPVYVPSQGDIHAVPPCPFIVD
jgi:hypothetical protein